MNQRLITLVLFVLSLAAILAGYVLIELPEFVLSCGETLLGCPDQDILFGIAIPMYKGSLLLPALFLILMFVPKNLFVSWLKFAAFTVPILLVLIIVSPPIPYDMFTPSRSLVTPYLVNLFVGASVIYLVLRHVLQRRAAKSTQAK